MDEWFKDLEEYGYESDIIFDIMYDGGWDNIAFIKLLCEKDPKCKELLNPLNDELFKGHNFFLAFPDEYNLEKLPEDTLIKMCSAAPLILKYIPLERITPQMIQEAFYRYIVEINHKDRLAFYKEFITNEVMHNKMFEIPYHVLDIQKYLP